MAQESAMREWNELWRQARKKRTWQAKSKEDWNRRSAGFAQRNAPAKSLYVKEFLGKLSVGPEMTVLDMGSGPGTIAIPLAEKVSKVTAVDFSPEMIGILERYCLEHGIGNIETIVGAWEDDWAALEIVPHDLVIASRSLAVDDLQQALEKLDRWALKGVVISDRVGNGPFDPALFRAVGRTFVPGPDYIYTLNILYQMGINATVEFISPEAQRRYHSRQEAVDSCAWMLDALTEREEKDLWNHLHERLAQDADGGWLLAGQPQPKWAIIKWEK